jgi:DNA repair protein RecO (recombination protein O)
MPREERNIRVEAVVLRHNDWGEADRLLVLFSRERGKLRAVAKGARRLRSRKAGHLEPFTRVTVMLAKGRDMWIVTQAETVEAYQALREDLTRTGYAAYVIELLDRFTYEEGENRVLFELLVRTLKRVNEEPDPFLAVRYYELHLLDILGFRPELTFCTGCGNEIQPEDQFFSAQGGGVVCPKCGSSDYNLRPISMRALKYMRHLQRSSWQEASRAQVPTGVRREMEETLDYYLTYLLERALNTPEFLRMVRRGPAAVEDEET